MRKALRRLKPAGLSASESKSLPAPEIEQSELGSVRSLKALEGPGSRSLQQPLEGGQSLTTEKATLVTAEALGAEAQNPSKTGRKTKPRSALFEPLANGSGKLPGRQSGMASSVHLDKDIAADGELVNSVPGTFKEGDLAAVIETVEARAVMVHSSCGMDEQLYKEHLELPGLFNLRLRIKNASKQQKEEFPARLALTDAMKHFGWMAERYETLGHEFPNLAWNEVMTVDIHAEASQPVLHALVGSLYSTVLCIDSSNFEEVLLLANHLQAPCLLDAALVFMKAQVIPKHPAVCFELGLRFYPELNLEESVLEFYRHLQWDGAISQAMLQDFGFVLEHCSEQLAVNFLHSLTRAPALISTLQVASMAAQLSAAKREKLLAGLKFDNLSMADVQSLLHWANNRQVNRAVLAGSPILWNLFYSNISISLLPLDSLEQTVGPKASQMKLWDLPLAHIAPNPGQYRTRRSGWMHLNNDRSFCMEAVFSDEVDDKKEWGLFCNPDRNHAFQPGYTIRMCAIQQGQAQPLIQLSPDIKPEVTKRQGLGLGFDGLLSLWAQNPNLVWEKEGEFYLTLGLYVDIDEASITETVASEGQQRQVVEPAGSSLTRGLSTRSIAEEVIQEEDLPPLKSPGNGVKKVVFDSMTTLNDSNDSSSSEGRQLSGDQIGDITARMFAETSKSDPSPAQQ